MIPRQFDLQARVFPDFEERGLKQGQTLRFAQLDGCGVTALPSERELRKPMRRGRRGPPSEFASISG